MGKVLPNTMNVLGSNVSILVAAMFGQDLIWIDSPVVQMGGPADYAVNFQSI